MQRVRLGVDPGEVLIRRGIQVTSEDGQPVGTVDHVLVDPATRRLTHIVFHRGAWLAHGYDVMVPAELVAKVGETGVRLKVPSSETDRLPQYRPAATDGELTTRVTRTLETQPETRGQGLRLQIERGLVRLLGQVPEGTAHAAVGMTRHIRGVVGVEDRTTRSSEPGPRTGAPVFAVDGRVGTVDKIVVDPNTHRVTHLVLRRGFLLAEDRVVPVDFVDRVTPDGNYLHIASQELGRQPRYEERELVSLPPTASPPFGYSRDQVWMWGSPYMGVPPPVLPVVEQVVRHGVPENEIVVERGVQVHASGDVVGEVDHLLVNPTREEITHLVVDLFDSPHSVIVPVDWVEDMGDDYVNLKRSREELQSVPTYARQSDEEIATAVQAALHHAGAEAFRGIRLEVDRGLVRLSGAVPTDTAKVEAERIARAVPGVIGVKDELLTNTAIVARVIEALAREPRTAPVPIEVSSIAGVVTLNGQVDTTETKAAAEQIARQVPGVQVVINGLTVRPRGGNPDDPTPASAGIAIRRG